MSKRNPLLFTLIFLVMITSQGVAQQYPVFSQYYFNPLIINPAYAGANVEFTAIAMYRNQWVNFPGAPKTYSITGHSSLMKNKIGVGLIINHDVIGSYKNQHVYGSFAYKIHSRNATLSMGLQAGVNILGADYSALDIQHPDDPNFSEFFNSFKPNFGAGLYYTRKNFFVGFSVPFILNNKMPNSFGEVLNDIIEARYYFIRTGTVFPLTKTENVKLNPSVLVRAQEGQPLTFDINAAFIFYDIFSLGASYRLNDAFINFIDLKLSEKFHFSYSFDWTGSSLNNFTRGSHEFVLVYRAKISSVHKNLECPSYYNYRN